MGQRVDTDKQPHEVFLEVAADRGAEYPCPEYGRLCEAHVFHEFIWCHPDLFQYHCYVTARVPRMGCPDHGTKQVKMPWAREGSWFTLLLEQAAMTLVREMSVLAAARIIGVSDTRLSAQWRTTHFTRHALKYIAPDTKTLAPVLKALMTLEEHAHLDPKSLDLQPCQRPPGGRNGLFQAARARVRGYRNVFTFMTIIYFTVVPLGELIKFHS
ncbi:transposase [Desulfarculales bacterium]